jgi:hypothetical protein
MALRDAKHEQQEAESWKANPLPGIFLSSCSELGYYPTNASFPLPEGQCRG